jgi:aryl-alcohol dehydrogenase-like predicted oxidoreductase
MKFRRFPNTDIAPVSEIGFGMWTVSTGWWGNYTEGEAIEMMHLASDLGINFFDAADTYGNGLSEELLAKAFPGSERDKVVIATKVGYNFYDFGNERRGEREIPQDFSADFIARAVDLALSRLKTDRIDLLQLHNIRLEQVQDDALWTLVEKLKDQGKILGYGAALGPAIGWLYEGIDTVAKRNPHVLQHIYNLFEQHPGQGIMDAGGENGQTRFLIRVPHSSGMLEGKYTADTVFDPNDHRRHRPRSWLLSGIQKVEAIRFLERADRSLGQASLLWLLEDKRIASVLPNVYDKEQLAEFARAVDCPPLTQDDIARLAELKRNNFGVSDEEPGKFKGTMTREPETATV